MGGPTELHPPAPARVQRIGAAALRCAEDTLFARIFGRLSAVQAGAVRDLIDAPAGERDGVLDLDEHDAGGSGGRTTGVRVGLVGPQLLGLIRSEPGAVSLESMLTEIDKLLAIRQVDLPREFRTG